MHSLVVPRGQHAVSCRILCASTPDGDVLSLGRWDHVYVGSTCYLLYFSGSLFFAFTLRYSFAVLLSGCRSVIRPGAMWFIKDPQDQNSHPIRDILDRPTFTQLRKICVSGIMYSFVVACVVGSVAGLLVLGSKSSIMPFRWKNRYVILKHFLQI